MIDEQKLIQWLDKQIAEYDTAMERYRKRRDSAGNDHLETEAEKDRLLAGGHWAAYRDVKVYILETMKESNGG